MSKKVDDIANKELLKKLESLGLSDKEARVYIALLPRQDTGTSNLIRATGLHGQFVYMALERLEELGLAKHVVQSGRKKFSANPPERILALVEEKKLAARAVVQQLHQQFAGKHEQAFEVFQGDTAFVAHEFALLEQMPEGDTICILGGGGHKYVSLMGSDMNEYERRRIEKKVHLRYISTDGNHNYLKIMAQTRAFFDYRVLPEAVPGVDTDILMDKINFLLFGEPVVAFTFTNKEISDGYRRFFEVLWNLSSK
ncbi:MAG TPA: helix-turn-helix domain-containing protein [Candidatus Paceibacterota bacterium]|nr:helix-turn-helix domain-containing protein [Candidatus Paceibacterota bacterium]